MQHVTKTGANLFTELGFSPDEALLYQAELRERIDHEKAVTLENVPTSGVNFFVAELARQHRISYVKTGRDALSDVVTQLAGDNVRTDETEDLIVALRLANVIDGLAMVLLLGRHLDERRIK